MITGTAGMACGPLEFYVADFLKQPQMELFMLNLDSFGYFTQEIFVSLFSTHWLEDRGLLNNNKNRDFKSRGHRMITDCDKTSTKKSNVDIKRRYLSLFTLPIRPPLTVSCTGVCVCVGGAASLKYRVVQASNAIFNNSLLKLKKYSQPLYI